MTADMLVSLGMNSVYSLPLVLAWLYAFGVGVWVFRRSAGAGVCLMAAAFLELSALLFGIGGVLVDRFLLDSLSFEAFNIFVYLRSVVRVLVLLISHTLLLIGIYGWRSVD